MKAYAPSSERNRDAILAELRLLLPPAGTVLEIASGSGQHCVYFARALPQLQWQPSDLLPDALASIAAWRDEAALPNLLPPVRLNAVDATWPVGSAAAMLCVNMIHIAPWQACLGLMAGAARTLPAGGALYLYGPFFRDEVATAASNIEFDTSLRAMDRQWGIRRLETVAEAAGECELGMGVVREMPANNLLVEFVRG